MTQLPAHLRERYAFESWAQARPSEKLFVWRFRIFGAELPDWSLVRAQQVATKEARVNLSIWRPTEGGPTFLGDQSTLLAIDVYESPSADAAREQLLRLLGEFQGPPLERQPALGEVAFGVEHSALLFGRGNLTVLVRNAERLSTPIVDAAGAFDRHLGARPEVTTGRGPRLVAFRAVEEGGVAPGKPLPLMVTAEAPRQEHVWFKFFSDTGEIRLLEDTPAYVGAAAGPHRVQLFAIDANGYATAESLQLEDRR